ncbi:MAG: hypothetical protein HPY76_08105 [Anaerolineae bacterium]|jgi:hypothetical protein|nr:hypothetical protein [Anaerolineae bacterium]
MPDHSIWTRDHNNSPITLPQSLLLLVILIGIGAIVGTLGSYTIPLGYGVTIGPWFGVTIQNIGGIWFGAWGVIAGAVFPLISNSLAGAPIWISLAYIPANALQAFVPAWAFRRTKADSSLRSRRDWLVFLVSTLVANLIGSIWAVLVVLNPAGMLVGRPVILYLLGWFLGNEIATLVGDIVILKLLSELIVQRRYFIRGWFR